MLYLVFLLTCICQCCVSFPRSTVGWSVFVLDKRRNAEKSDKYVNCCRQIDCLNFATSKYDSRKENLNIAIYLCENIQY